MRKKHDNIKRRSKVGEFFDGIFYWISIDKIIVLTIIGFWGKSKGNPYILPAALFFIGIVLLFNLFGWLSYKFDTNVRSYPGITDDSDDDEPFFIRVARSKNDVVDDPFEGPLIINHSRKALEDEYGNKRADLDEIEENYVKDSYGHRYDRNRYK